MLQGEGAGRAERIEVLDGLRLVAALAVVAYHLMISAGGERLGAWPLPSREQFGPLATGVAEFGWLGVHFFFVISGFVICLSAWGRSPSQFLVSRAVRIYPAYWFTVLLAAGVSLAFGTDRRPRSLEQVLVNLTMLERPLGVRELDPVFWTLWAELRFYLLFGVVVLAGVTVRNVLAFCLVWLVGSVVAVQSGSALLEVVLVPEYAPCFVAGVALYLVRRQGSSLPLWLLVGLSWALAQHHLAAQVHATEKNLKHGISDLVASGLVTAAFVVVALVATGRLDRVRGRWLTVAGTLTYPLYLVHKNLGTLVVERLAGRVPTWPLLLGLTASLLVLAWLVHRLVERPLAGWLRPRLQHGLDALLRPAAEAGPVEATASGVPAAPARARTGAHVRTGPPAAEQDVELALPGVLLLPEPRQEHPLPVRDGR